METGTQNEKEKQVETPKTGMRKFMSRFMTFLAYGGFLVVIIVLALIGILISYLTK